MSPSRFGAIPLLLLAASSCGTPTGNVTPPADTRVKDSAPILEFAVQPFDGEKVEITMYHPKQGFDLELGPRRVFDMVAMKPTADDIGYPALHFEVAKEQREDFRLWTASHVGKHLAIFVDNRLVVAPIIQSALPGSGIISFGFGDEHPSIEELQHLSDRILAQPRHSAG